MQIDVNVTSNWAYGFALGVILVFFVAASLKVSCMKAKHKICWEILSLIYSFDSVGISSFKREFSLKQKERDGRQSVDLND